MMRGALGRRAARLRHLRRWISPSTILLVPRVELGPLSYGIYLYMQSAVGRGPGARARGRSRIVLVAAGTWAATALARRSGASARFRT